MGRQAGGSIHAPAHAGDVGETPHHSHWDGVSPPRTGTTEHPCGKPGRDWDRAPQLPDCSSFFSFFFFFLKSLHLFSFCPRAPAGVFILAGCWVIYLLALLSPLAGVFQVGSLNSSEPRARGGARWVVLISNTLPKKRRVLFPMFAAAVFVQRGADAPARGDAVARSRGAGVAVSALGLSSPSRKAAVSTSAGTVRGTSASLGVLRHPSVSLNVP